MRLWDRGSCCLVRDATKDMLTPKRAALGQGRSRLRRLRMGVGFDVCKIGSPEGWQWVGQAWCPGSKKIVEKGRQAAELIG